MSVMLVLLLATADESLDLVLTRASADRDVVHACAEVDRWVEKASDRDEIGRALLWQVQALTAIDAFSQAEGVLVRLASRTVSDEVRFDAALLRADLTLLEGQPALAAAQYSAIQAPKDSRWDYVAKLRAARAVEEAARFRLAWAVALTLGALSLGGALVGRKRLRQPPEEFVWVAPVLALLALAAIGLQPAERRAVLSVAIGGAALVYCNGLALRARPPTSLLRVLAVGLGLAQSVGLLFSSVVLSGLWLRVADTLASGVE